MLANALLLSGCRVASDLTETALQKTDGNLSSADLQDGPEAVNQPRVPNLRISFFFFFVKGKLLMFSLL